MVGVLVTDSYSLFMVGVLVTDSYSLFMVGVLVTDSYSLSMVGVLVTDSYSLSMVVVLVTDSYSPSMVGVLVTDSYSLSMVGVLVTDSYSPSMVGVLVTDSYSLSTVGVLVTDSYSLSMVGVLVTDSYSPSMVGVLVTDSYSLSMVGVLVTDSYSLSTVGVLSKNCLPPPVPTRPYTDRPLHFPWQSHGMGYICHSGKARQEKTQKRTSLEGPPSTARTPNQSSSVPSSVYSSSSKNPLPSTHSNLPHSSAMEMPRENEFLHHSRVQPVALSNTLGQTGRKQSAEYVKMRERGSGGIKAVLGKFGAGKSPTILLTILVHSGSDVLENLEMEDIEEVLDAELEELGNEELQELTQNPSPESDSEEDKPSRTFTTKSMATAFHRIQGLQMLADEDPDVERSARVHRTFMEGLTCYQEIYKEKKRAVKQLTIRAFFQPMAAMHLASNFLRAVRQFNWWAHPLGASLGTVISLCRVVQLVFLDEVGHVKEWVIRCSSSQLRRMGQFGESRVLF
uniref:Uncharacterized protein n=1 Tax=Timema genevievae TaxID=629358 RepID=A0A7R9K6J7_TIMGE|nr:unnamed protein product [Timema genevievae]